MIRRNITQKLLDALTDTPVVLITGARQTGKSTLVQAITSLNHITRQYISFDVLTTLSAARSDPQGFIEALDQGFVILDEIQRVPELLLAIKTSVDKNRIPGKFLLTGSANVLMLPKVSESLAGRMEILKLYPFSQTEIMGSSKNFVDMLFEDKKFLFGQQLKLEKSIDIIQRIVLGGYPEIQTRKTEARRYAWFASYITTLVERDIKDFSNIEGILEIPRLLSLLAASSGHLIQYSNLASAIGLPQSTLKRYISLLLATNLVYFIPAWSTNFGKRIVRSPKILLNDTALIIHLLGLNEERLKNDSIILGRIFECFVLLELLKQCSFSNSHASCFHFRTTTGHEVDAVLEYPTGDIIGIEVKCRSTVTANDFKGLKILAEDAVKHFRMGIVIYLGEEVVPFGEKFFAVPVHLMWS